VEAFFPRGAGWTARATGHPASFVMALLVIIVWAVTGPIFGFSDTWQLVINTGTTIATFLMVFLIQNTQNRDTAAIQLKLAELIRAQGGAKNTMLDLEDLTEEQLDAMHESYSELAQRARKERDGRAGSRTSKPAEIDAAVVAAKKAERSKKK
jgi:low affinity Fe/Cu permease